MRNRSVRNMWERQPWENDVQWYAFQLYRDMPRPRSVDGAYRIHFAQKRGLQPGEPSVAKKRAVGGWQNWSRGRKWDGETIPDAPTWEARTAAYDAYLDNQVQAQLESALVEERRLLIQDELRDYKAQLKKWREMYERTLLHEQQRQGRALKRNADGTPTGDEIEIIFAELNLDDWFLLSRWRKIISEQGRRAMDMPDRQRTELTGKDGEALGIVHVDDMAELFQQIQRHKEAERRDSDT